MSLKSRLREAWDTDRSRYWKRQRFLLRSMNIHNKRKIPVVPSSEIFDLFTTSGSNKVYVETFLNEYYQLMDDLLEDEFNGELPQKHTSMLEYAQRNDYDIVFHQGDIIRNPHYDPSVKCVSIYDQVA